MFAVLLDVSGSMQQAYERDRSHDTSLRRTHAVLTTTAEIVKQEVTHHKRRDYIFTCAFGLRKPTATCDLIPLLEALGESRQGAPYDALVELAREARAPHAERWIREHLTELEAALLNHQLRLDRSLIRGLIERLPSPTTSAVTGFASNLFGSAYERAESQVVHRSEAYSYAQDIVARGIARPSPKSVQYVSKLMDDLLKKRKPQQSDDSTLDRMQELIDAIEPHIYGGTPMCKAMQDALSIFRSKQGELDDQDASKVLFILSDGESSDGDPLPIAKELKALGVSIVTCYLTANHIEKPKRLLDAKDPKWGAHVSPQSVLFEMSSTMHNSHTPVSYLVDAGWELPSSGESRLFLQANSLDVVNELCRVVVSQMTKGCDALVDILAKVSLATYINQTNADFKPKEQAGETCYANAVAAVLHLAMQRIVKREGGVPDFDDLRQKIVDKYGEGAITRVVLEHVCPEYRLRFCILDNETAARKAINERRPVIAIFRWYEQEYKKFYRFFRNNKKGILKRADLHTSKALTVLGGHAVVLTRCDSKCLTFMNSWGTDFADEGFFRVEDSLVLRDMFFYDVYWEPEDLTLEENQAFKMEGTRSGQELLQTFPSLQDLPYKCPECKKISKVVEYYGNLLVAKCPQCHENFVPKNEQLLESLYIRNMKY